VAVWSKHSRERICPTIMIAPVIDDRQQARLGYIVCVSAAIQKGKRIVGRSRHFRKREKGE